MLKGLGSKVQRFANNVIAERGVRHGHVVYMPASGSNGYHAMPTTTTVMA